MIQVHQKLLDRHQYSLIVFLIRSLLVKLLYLSFGISIFINFSLKLLMYTSVAASLLRWLKVDFGLKWSRSNSSFSFLKCHFNLHILPSASNSVLSFALSTVLEVGTKFKSFRQQKYFRTCKIPSGEIHNFLTNKTTL